jgi:Reverse transcriptase (RNA-dependent DNA polymerase)
MKQSVIIICIHVDDMLLAGTGASIIHFKESMLQHFSLKLLGQVKFILGIQVKCTATSISLSQETYIL